MRIYLSGPMRGKVRFNFPAFDAAAEELRANGHEVFSPAEKDRKLHGPEIEFMTWEEIQAMNIRPSELIRPDLDYILDYAEAIALLPGWENSTGANAEVALGKFLKIPCENYEEFCRGREQAEQPKGRTGH